MVIAIYLMLCLVVALAGRSRKPGFLGFFLLSILLTPVVTLLYLLISQRYIRRRRAAELAMAQACAQCVRERKQKMDVWYCPKCGKVAA